MTTRAVRQSAPRRALKSPLAVPGASAAPASGPHDALAPAPGRAALSDREATLAEFQGYLRTVNSRDGRPFEEKTIAVYCSPVKSLDRWMTASGISGDFTVVETAMLNQYFREYYLEHGQGGTHTQQRNLIQLFNYLERERGAASPYGEGLNRYAAVKGRPKTLDAAFIDDLLEVTGSGRARDFETARDRALLPLAELPHCGAVVSRVQTERATRLLRRLAAELSRRQELLAAAGLANIAEQRAAVSPSERLPHVFVLLDRWEGFTSTLGELEAGALTEIITRLLSEGASTGMHLIMTGDRTLLLGRIAALCEDKLVFKLAEKDDYRLAGLNPRDLPESVPPGRAFRAGSGAEVQVALLATDASGQGQTSALQSIAAYCRSRDEGLHQTQRPFRVDVLPSHVSFADAWHLRPVSAGPLWGLVGVGGDTLAALGPDLATGTPCFIVAGPAKSGRSTILLAMARSFLAAGTPVVLAAPRPSPLRALAGVPGVLRLFDRAELGDSELAEALASFSGPGVVLVDDAELLRDCDAAGQLSRLIALGGDAGRALVLGGDAESIGLGFSGWQVEAKRARRGCLTAPSTIPDGDLIGARLSRDVLGQPPHPGRCLLHTGDGKLITVSVPAS